MEKFLEHFMKKFLKTFLDKSQIELRVDYLDDRIRENSWKKLRITSVIPTGISGESHQAFFEKSVEKSSLNSSTNA